jgi:hypothetical protein
MKIRSFLTALTILFTLSSIIVSATPLTSVNPVENSKTIKERISKMTTEQKDARVAEIKLRIQEIKSMDKSQLTSEQRKALRKELREMKKEAKQMGPTYVYISGAGLVIIILILILIL